MTTIAAIAAEALDAVALDITDAVHTATLTRTLPGAYDAVNGAYIAATETDTGRAVFCNVDAVPDLFPAYAVGPSDQLMMLEGFTSVAENDALTIGTDTRTVRAVQDIGGAGSLFYAVAR